MNALLLLFGGYVVVWLGLLVHCIVRREFFPVLGRGKATKAFWLVTFLLFNPALTVWYVLWGVLAPRKATPSIWKTAVVVIPVVILVVAPWLDGVIGPGTVSMVRNGQGAMEQHGGSPLDVRADLSSSNAQDHMTTTSAEGVPDGARASFEHIVILAETRSRLLRNVAEAVQQNLAQLSYVRRIDLYPYGTEPPQEGRAPDLVITLDVPRQRMILLPFFARLDTDVLFTCANEQYISNTSYTEFDTPPMIDTYTRGHVEHHEAAFGIGIAWGSLRAPGQRIGKDVANSIQKKIAELREKYGAMPGLPEALYGPYNPPIALPFLAERQAKRVSSHIGLLAHNITLWRIDDASDAVGFLAGIEQQMLALGWKTDSFDKAENAQPYLRMRNGSQILAVFVRRPEDMITGGGTRTYVGQEASWPQPLVIVRYEERFTDDERARALRAFLATNPSPEAIAPFRGLLKQAGITLN